MDHMERTKMFMGSDKMMEMGASPRSRLVLCTKVGVKWLSPRYMLQCP